MEESTSQEKGQTAMKQYRLSHLSFDYLAMNKQLATYAARYTFIHEYWDNKIGQYIVANRKVFGEIVRVVIRYD